jgi:hypothetical protein
VLGGRFVEIDEGAQRRRHLTLLRVSHEVAGEGRGPLFQDLHHLAAGQQIAHHVVGTKSDANAFGLGGMPASPHHLPNDVVI